MSGPAASDVPNRFLGDAVSAASEEWTLRLDAGVSGMENEMKGSPAAACVRAIGRAAERCIRTAGHRACGLSLSQHDLILAEITKLYDIASWIERHDRVVPFGVDSRTKIETAAGSYSGSVFRNPPNPCADASPPKQD